MFIQYRRRTMMGLTAFLLIAPFLVFGCHANAGELAMTPEQRKRLTAARAEGTKAAVTVFPVKMLDRPFKDVAEVFALFLEKRGMSNLYVADGEFSSSTNASMDESVKQFADFVRENRIATNYAFYGEFIGTPETGPSEIGAVHFVVCDAEGEWVIVDFQNEHHADFQSIDPKTFDDCARLVARRLAGFLR